MLIVFDLDFTLWDAGGTWCDETTPPYQKLNGYITDAGGRIIYLYPDVPSILSHLRDKGILMGVASRTHGPATARKLMDMFEIRKYFTYEEIYPGSKIQHFERLQKSARVPFESIYFFDDEQRNVNEVGAMGVQAHLVVAGLSWNELERIPGI